MSKAKVLDREIHIDIRSRPGAGKTTVARECYERLKKLGFKVILIDPSPRAPLDIHKRRVETIAKSKMRPTIIMKTIDVKPKFIPMRRSKRKDTL